MDKYNRSNFYKTEVVDSLVEKDLLTNVTNIFDNNSEYSFYRVKEEDLLRPDLISLKLFKTIAYWWIILKANNIEDVWHDLYAGKILAIPPISDIEKYYSENVAKNKGK